MDESAIKPQETYLDVLVSIEKQLEVNQKANVIFALPETEAQFKTLQQDKDFKKVVWRRLYALGYADRAKLKSRWQNVPERRFISAKSLYKKAVERFQKDAGTQPDGWVGLETWESLQELFTFEHDTHLNKWLKPQYQHVLHRAIHLRLIILGFAEKPGGKIQATGTSRALTAGLARCAALLGHLNVDQAEAFATCLDYIFDIDKLTKRVAKNFSHLQSWSALSDGGGAVDVAGFLKSLLKIELWLYGFEGIMPGHQGPEYQVRYLPPVQRHVKKAPLATALSDFLDEFKVDVPKETQHHSFRLMELALVQLAQLDDDTIRQVHAAERSALLSKSIEPLTNKQHQDLRKYMCKTGFGNWLFDGLKRFYRWLKSVASHVMQSIYEFRRKLKMLAVAAKRIASDTFSFVRRGMKVLVDGFKYLVQPEWKMFDKPEENAVLLWRSADMDSLVFVNTQASAEQVHAFNEQFRKIMIRVRAAITIANWLVNEAINLFKDMAISGPLAMVTLLIRIYKMRGSQEFELMKQAYITY
ncbi:peptidoglycan-binding domain-containing protein [Celerinatantimonas sp. YJH-8]|uniref:peptidoglycan-binding domain-containing protein n=1 Tax=Celerinatantimonas sp. YJH-8 TaxID=3228714 RepID=UPI0038C33C8E